MKESAGLSAVATPWRGTEKCCVPEGKGVPSAYDVGAVEPHMRRTYDLGTQSHEAWTLLQDVLTTL